MLRVEINTIILIRVVCSPNVTLVFLYLVATLKINDLVKIGEKKISEFSLISPESIKGFAFSNT